MISCTLRIKYKPILSFLVATFLTFSVFAQGEQADVAKEGVTAGAPAAQAAGGDPALISAGDALFKNNCASCHAASARLGELRTGWLFLPTYQGTTIDNHVLEFKSGEVEYPGLMMCEWSSFNAPDPAN